MLFLLPLMGQDYAVIDGLKNELISKQGDERAKVLLALAWEYRKSQPDSSLYYCREILRIAPEGENPFYPQAMNFMGVAFHYKGDDVKAYDYYTRARDSAVQLSDSVQLAHALNNLGRFYLNQGDQVRSYELLSEASDIFEMLDDKNDLSYVYKSIAELYISQDKYQKALEMTGKTLELRKQSGNVPGQVSVLNDIAEIYLDLDNFDEAIPYYEEAMLLAAGQQDYAMMANIHLGLADAYCRNDMFDVAFEEADKAGKLNGQLNNQDLDNRINLMKGKLLYKMGDYTGAESYLIELMSEAESSRDLNLEREANYYTALLFKSTGRMEQAFDRFQRFHETVYKLENAENARMIERLEARIEIESKERENQLLAAEKAAAEANEERLRLQNILLIAGILGALVISVILYFMYRKRQETNRKLIAKNNFIATQREEIRKQNEQIASQNDKLRHRNKVLKDLNNEKDTLMNILAHDLKAPFNRIKGLVQIMQLSSVNEEDKKYIEMLNGAADNGINLIRDLLEVSAFSSEERKPVMEDLSLSSQLKGLRDTYRSDAESKHIDIIVDMKDDVVIPTDPSYLSRILDNLISNAIKFSEPGKKVILSGGLKDSVPYVSVKDFGPGFSENDRKNLYHKFARLSAQPTAGESSNGLGLAIVKLLVDSLEGEIDLISEPGKGSEFILRFPAPAGVESPARKR